MRRKFPGFSPVATVTAFLLVPAFVAAQTAVTTNPATSFTAGWRDGFLLQTENGDYRLQLNALLQADERFAIDDPQNDVINTFTFRRIRPILQGRVAGYFEFYFNPDFAGAMVNIRDAYVDTRFSPAVRIRVGKGKTPFGLERLQSASFLTFVERALPTAVAPDRDIGVQVLGEVSGGLVSYHAGVLNGVTDGGSAEVDSNDAKDVVARLVVRPFVSNTSSRLGGLGVAIAGSSGRQPAVLPSFRTSSQQTFFAYDHLAIGEGVRNRLSTQYFYYYKSLGSFGEYVRSTGRVTKGSVSDEITHEALLIAGSVVITGESGSDHGVKPKNPFDPSKHTWGALQIAARYHLLSVDPRAVRLGFAPADSSREAMAYTIGANWYLNPYVKWVVNFERTTFRGDHPRHAESAILVRNQFTF